ncbi:hypothetical protein [Nostoc linckia]|nr:hypothetical protein [Nostoc linckia]
MGRWGDEEVGERLKVKGKRDKFNLFPLPFPPYPFPFPHSLECPMTNDYSLILGDEICLENM